MKKIKNFKTGPSLWKAKARTAICGLSLGAVVLGAGIAGFGYSPEGSTTDRPVFSMGTQELRDAVTIPHFAKISGIGEVLREDGVEMSSNLETLIKFSTRLSELKYIQYKGFDAVQESYDMARSEGALEARNGAWSVDSLSVYVDEVMALDDRFLRLARTSAAYLQEEGFSPSDADKYVRQSIGIAYRDYTSAYEDVVPTGMVFAHKDDVEIVMGMHERIHSFLRKRLTSLDESDHRFNLNLDQENENPKNETLSDETPSIDM